MSSFGNAIERWSMADLRNPVNSEDYTNRISPAKSIATVVDSAYSSFSGSSYVVDYQTSFQNDSYHLNNDPRPYMDTEYVKAIYNPSTVDNGYLLDKSCMGDGAYNADTFLRTDSISMYKTKSKGSTNMSHSPPKRLDCCVTLQDIERFNVCGGNDSPCSQSIKLCPINISHFSSEHKVSQHQSKSSTWMKDGIQGDGSQERILPSFLERKENHYFGRPSFMLHSDGFPEMEESVNQNVLPSHLTEEVSSTYDNKKIPHINKLHEHFLKGMDLEIKENIPRDFFSNAKDVYIEQKECIPESNTDSKSTKCSSSEPMSERLGAYDNKGGIWVTKPGKEAHCYFSEKESDEVIQLAIGQPYKAQNEPMSIDCDSHGQCDKRHKMLDTKASQIFYHGPSDSESALSVKPLNSENAVNEGTKIHRVRKDATIRTIPMLSLQSNSEKYQNNFCELTSDKITKEATPMLYHLSGGRNNPFAGRIHSINQVKQTEQNPESKTCKNLDNISTAQVTEDQINVKQLRKNRSQSQLSELTDNLSNDDGTTGSLTSSAEESFMHDYREKLKVAQKKVLRETSFKRKDLQMSLPGRLKLNPSKRPTIDHLRSHSLSSANEETKLVPPKTSVDINCKKFDPEKSVSRIGGRKRITKEQRKLCYSEPEKLDHLGIQNSGFTWREGSTIYTQSKTSNSDMALKVRSLDNKERTVSTSNLSKTELKQIQQNALMQYMERKTNQRPNSNPQGHMQRTSGMKKYERKSMPSDKSCNDLAQAYIHRRSTGASSSYDATVTWSDRFIRNSPCGDSGKHADLSVEEKCMTYLDQCILEDKKYSEDYPPSFCQKSKPAQLGQVSKGCRTFSASVLSNNNNQDFSNRLSVTEGIALMEDDRASSSRGRGKSMEDIGTADIVRLSVLSQSTDQLYHIKELLKLPRTESASCTSVVHQERLWVSTENDLGNVPSKTSREDARPRRSNVASSAHDKHSRPSRVSAVSSATETYISQEVLHAGALEKSKSLESEDEVFSQAVAIRKELCSRISYGHQEDSRRPLSYCDETPSFVTVMPGHVTLEHTTVTDPEASSESDEKDLPENGDKLKDDSVELVETQTVRKSPDPTADSEDIRLAESKPMSNSQQEELLLVPSSQVNVLQTSQSLVVQSKPDENNGKVGQESEASVLTSADPGGEADFPRVELKAPEDDRHAELIKEIIAEDKSLSDILKPLPVRESAMDLMKSLFLMDISEMEKCRHRGSPKKDNNEILSSNRKSSLEGISKLSPKTMLLLEKCSRQIDGESQGGITAKKTELMSSICSKLEELCEQRELLLSDIRENLSDGKNMEAVVKEICKPNEYERYMMFIGDLEKVVSLLFCLSMRLARVENALSKIDDNTDAEEMQSLKERHNLLSRQREDAKDLKENLDRRERVVTGILAKYLSENQIQDYKHFVRFKTSFLIEQKDLDEKIKFHEEQLESLHNSIPP
ncbi:Shroom1 isoform X1 [Pelobates cultripes]|uniref:Shroom1 isoform X1 n=1 Tax=Pelobates cultripes TaxID=61616 RepID=A0AAD1RTT4_PELCU|nr:Shroom1 isoform X1 [Pelobates cultripes]